jgi:hypothetical protein
VDFRKFVLPSPLWGFGNGNELDLSHRSEWIRVERHPLWVAKRWEEILCLCASHFELLPVLV